MDKRFFKRITSVMLCVIMLFCINASHVNAADEINIATHLALQASPIYGYKMDPPHNSVKQIYNLPHVHIRENASGTPGLTHIWYLGI